MTGRCFSHHFGIHRHVDYRPASVANGNLFGFVDVPILNPMTPLHAIAPTLDPCAFTERHNNRQSNAMIAQMNMRSVIVSRWRIVKVEQSLARHRQLTFRRRFIVWKAGAVVADDDPRTGKPDLDCRCFTGKELIRGIRDQFPDDLFHSFSPCPADVHTRLLSNLISHFRTAETASLGLRGHVWNRKPRYRLDKQFNTKPEKTDTASGFPRGFATPDAPQTG